LRKSLCYNLPSERDCAAVFRAAARFVPQRPDARHHRALDVTRAGRLFFESSSRSIFLFEHDLRANAFSRLSRGKTGVHPRVKPEGRLFPDHALTRTAYQLMKWWIAFSPMSPITIR
jgi:hypothetical protein